MNEYRVQAGDQFSLISFSSDAARIFARLNVTSDSGQDHPFETLQTPNTDRTAASTLLQGFVPEDGFVTRAFVSHLSGTSGVKRGQNYAFLQILDRAGRTVGKLCSGYLYEGNNIHLGMFESNLEGKGFLSWVQEADDIAGNASDTTALAIANARRTVRGIIVKYHSSSDSATRTLTITLRDMATAAGPTGWSIASDTWISPTLTLIANEEGLIHVGEHGFVSTNDAGTLAYADNSSAPNPFPLEVQDADTVDLIIAAGAGEAADDFDVWVQYEEWIEP